MFTGLHFYPTKEIMFEDKSINNLSLHNNIIFLSKFWLCKDDIFRMSNSCDDSKYCIYRFFLRGKKY